MIPVEGFWLGNWGKNIIMRNKVACFNFQGRIILSAMGRTEIGLILEVGPCFEIESSMPELEKGESLILMLQKFDHNLPNVDLRSLVESDTPVLKYLKIKSFRAFMKKAKVVFVEIDNASLRFVPTITRKMDGYVDLNEQAFEVPLDSVEHLFRRLMEAFELCRAD